MTNGWYVYYADGKCCNGTDHAVAARMASWTAACNDCIVAVDLMFVGKLIRIEGPGAYWQSDTYESSFNGPTKCIKRRIQRRIEPTDKFFRCAKTANGGMTVCFNGKLDAGKYFPINPRMYGKWLVLEHNCKNGAVFHHVSDRRI